MNRVSSLSFPALIKILKVKFHQSNKLELLVSSICLAFAIFVIFMVIARLLPAFTVRAIYALFTLVLAFLAYPLGKKYRFLDIFLIILSIPPFAYICIFLQKIVTVTGGELSNIEIFLGILAIVVILEATRRTISLVLSILAGLFIVYAYFGNYVPGVFGIPGYDIHRIITSLYLTSQGIFGLPLAVTIKYIFLFLIFGAFVKECGAATLMLDVGKVIGKRTAGGPAKMAVVASGILGSMSGSSVANVATTGAITIPMMKNFGFKPWVAGAIEAAASSGGQVMPPVMAATAFLMAEFMGVSYWTVCLAAFIPAVLWFIAVGSAVHFYSLREGFGKLEFDASAPGLIEALKKRGHLIISVIILVWLLVQGFTPSYAILWSTVSLILISLLRKETRIGPRGIARALISGARTAIGVSCAVLSAGMILAVVTLTGIGLKFSELLMLVTGGDIIPTLVITMVAALILGMGVGTTIVYILVYIMIIPALIQLGIEPMTAHFFVFYFGVVSMITPPVCFASYTAGAIAETSPMKTGVTGLLFALPIFLIPYAFAIKPGLLMNAPLIMILYDSLVSAAGVICLAAGITGFFLSRTKVYQRFLLIIAGALFLLTGYTGAIIALILVVITLISQKGVKILRLKKYVSATRGKSNGL